MKTYSYRTVVRDADADLLWQVWTDIDRWTTWQDDLELSRLEGALAAGSRFHIKPRGGPDVVVELLEVTPGHRFVDITRFPLAQMKATHDLRRVGEGIELTTTLELKGPLSFAWDRIVVRGIAASLESQTLALVQRARDLQREALPA